MHLFQDSVRGCVKKWADMKEDSFFSDNASVRISVWLRPWNEKNATRLGKVLSEQSRGSGWGSIERMTRFNLNSCLLIPIDNNRVIFLGLNAVLRSRIKRYVKMLTHEHIKYDCSKWWPPVSRANKNDRVWVPYFFNLYISRERECSGTGLAGKLRENGEKKWRVYFFFSSHTMKKPIRPLSIFLNCLQN